MWHCLSFDELSNRQLYQILKVRQEVFIVEQNCPYLDNDGKDVESLHFFKQDNDGEVLAYVRIVPPNLSFEEPAIGRVVTHPKSRGTGLGRELMEQAILKTQSLYPNMQIRIGAQQYLEKFYQSLGFDTDSDMYLEDDIPHIEMIYK